MKVVALVSGGKDSCYAMQRCIDYGHQIVALANLLPADDDVDELDSFMFQTVGHQMICAIAQCMGLPLFRKRIEGTSRLQDLRYRKTIGDEVEDLEKLLVAVKQKHPDIQAVSSGAIKSNYQRLRVENVCSRLGLISLAYMWEQDQATLLQSIIDSGIYAVLVKVAAIGMDPHKHLGKDLASLQPHLTRLGSLYGSNVCGEGGEYETLTLDSPLFKHARIILDEFEVALHSPDQIAPVGVLHPTKFHLEAKDPSAKFNPELLSSVIEVMGNVAVEETVLRGDEELAVFEDSANVVSNPEVQLTLMSQQHGVVTMGCWRQHCERLGLREELGLLLSTVEKSLHSKGLTWGNVVYVRLFLEDLAFFGLANEVYVKHITDQKCERGAPSRCCMQLCLPEAGFGGVLVEVTAASDSSKQVLHVQSISCWAPCCIGPYSQATLHRNILHMAGQLGLDPPTMELVQGGATLEMRQAMKNCEAVAEAFKVSLRGDAIAITIYCSAALTIEDQVQVEHCLQEFLHAEAEEDTGSDESHRISRYLKIIPKPLVLFLLVPALPKGAKVEVEPSLFVDSAMYRDIDSDLDSSVSWQRIHVETHPTTGRPKDSVIHTRTLLCTPCEGLILPRRYGRAMVFIRSVSADSPGSVNHSENSRNAQVDFQELQENILQAVTTIKCRVFETMAKLSWSDITAFRVYYDVNAVAAAPLCKAVTEALESVTDAATCSSVAPTFLPVSGVSCILGSRELNLLVLDVIAAGAHNQP
ncbi:hypothetical protein KC19_2G130800 [Ceratodon purpureus]|uniref:Diphthine--ammonia ligase n=1 Tax=Ceratodon purpureus TaxID=3225 RepID=A0A8T0IV06_CERPU|nr:hypothetical protein KC19_2G130800 [Ceratodon purpureus]